MKILNTIVLLFLTANHALAATKDTSKNLQEYDIEIIIFEDAHARYINSELWSQNNTNEPASLSDSTRKNEASVNLDKLSLTEINATAYKNIKPAILVQKYKRIKASSEYNVLFYGAWRQAGLNKAKAFEININELNNAHTNKSKNTLDGHFKLILARYLHIYGQLNYQRLDNQPPGYQSKTNNDSPAGTFDATTENLTPLENQSENINGDVTKDNTYPMNIHRRMRSKELHYIDHPLVGMLIQINPVKLKENTE